jgi:hypothetical protein
MLWIKYKKRLTNTSILPALLLILVLISIFSCRPEPLAPQEAVLYIVQPVADSVIEGDSVDIFTYTYNFQIADKIGQQNKPGEGHYIYYRDITPPIVKGKSAITAEGTYVTTTESRYTWHNISAGEHIFWVQLVNNDNTPLEAAVAVSVPVTVVNK